MPAVTPAAEHDAQSAPQPRVLVTVGTDHHPFGRLVEWVNDWLGQHPEQAGSFFVQWGTSPVRPVCAGSQVLAADQLSDLLDRADAVICHGGPGSIAEAWARGLVPIAVPRQRRLGEHVDDHQVDFCVKVAERSRVRLALTREAFDECLTQALAAKPASTIGESPFGSRDPEIEETVGRFAKLVDDLVESPGRRLKITGRFRRRPMRYVPAGVGALKQLDKAGIRSRDER